MKLLSVFFLLAFFAGGLGEAGATQKDTPSTYATLQTTLERQKAKVEVPFRIRTEREGLIQTFERLSQSVGALYAQEIGGNLNFLCSATAIDRQHGKTVILTAYHCVRKGVTYLINFGDNRYRSVHVWQVPRYEIDKDKFPRGYNEPKADLALFLMEGQDLPVVPLAKDDDIPSGSKIAMVGYPLGVAKISYEGIVAGKLDRPGSESDGYLLLQIFGAPGSSGSAVVAAKTGEIVGVLVAAQSSFGAGLPVIFATPTSYLEALQIVPGAVGAPDEDD